MKKTSQWLQTVAQKKAPANYMIDFETFGSNPDTCGIMSVAILRFDESEQFAPHNEVLLSVSMESNYERGFDMSSSQRWWNNPERTAAWCWYLNSDKESFGELVQTLFHFFHKLEEDGTPYLLWSRGDFDIRILRRLLSGTGVDIPYYCIRDARTFIRGLHINESRFVSNAKMLHSPLEDCRHCIACIQAAHKVLASVGFYNHDDIDAVSDDENRRLMQSVAERRNG